jgi:hypothetical protein
MKEKIEHNLDLSIQPAKPDNIDMVGAIVGIVKGNLALDTILDEEQLREKRELAALEVDDPKEAKFRKLYNEGFELMLADVPEQPNRAKNEQEKRLAMTKYFRHNMMAWTRLVGESVRTIEEGKRIDGVVAMIPPGHKYHPIEGRIMALEKWLSVNLLLIRPYEINKEWAGILMVDGVSGLLYRADASRKRNGKGNFKNDERVTNAAGLYGLRQAVDCIARFADDPLFEEVSRIFLRMRFKTIDDAVRWVNQPQSAVYLATKFDPLITSKKPKSPKEVKVRLHYYNMLFLRLIVGMMFPDKDIEQVNREFEKAYFIMSRAASTSDFMMSNQLRNNKR